MCELIVSSLRHHASLIGLKCLTNKVPPLAGVLFAEFFYSLSVIASHDWRRQDDSNGFSQSQAQSCRSIQSVKSTQITEPAICNFPHGPTMPPYINVSRSHLPILLLVIANFACGPLCLGQGNMRQANQWSPHRETDRSRAQISRRVQQKQIKLPPPVRLAQYQDPSIQSIQPGEITETMPDERPGELEFTEQPFSSPEAMHPVAQNPAAQHPMLKPNAIPGYAPGSPAHTVIRSPAMQAKQRSGATRSRSLASGSAFPTGGHHASASSPAGGLFHQGDKQHLPGPPLHGQHLKFAKKKWPLGPMQPRQARIPDARERPTWKQPYSYGYFGSSGNRHWGTHHGYRDRYTEYRYR